VCLPVVPASVLRAERRAGIFQGSGSAADALTARGYSDDAADCRHPHRGGASLCSSRSFPSSYLRSCLPRFVQTPGGDAKADGENSGDAAKATSPSTPLSPREAESDGGNEADEPSSPKLGADNSLSATGGTGEGDEGGGGGGKTGLSDDSDDEPAPTKLEGAATKKKVVDSDEEEEEARQDKDDGGKKAEEINAPAGKTGLSSDSESGDDSAPKKKSGEGGDGDTEMAEATHKDVFGESDSDDDAGGNNKHKGQKVTLNKETGQLERGEVEDAPDHALQDSQVGRDKRVVSKETLKVSMPALPRPPTGARLVYVNPPKRHLMLDHAPFGTVEEETKKIAAGASDRYYQSASSIRWRYKEQGDEGEPWEKRNKETNARFVEWSDGSLTLNIGEEVFQVKKEDLAKNAHHLYAKHSDAKTLAEDGEDENSSILPIIEGHGVMESRCVLVGGRGSVIKPSGCGAEAPKQPHAIRGARGKQPRSRCAPLAFRGDPGARGDGVL